MLVRFSSKNSCACGHMVLELSPGSYTAWHVDWFSYWDTAFLKGTCMSLTLTDIELYPFSDDEQHVLWILRYKGLLMQSKIRLAKPFTPTFRHASHGIATPAMTPWPPSCYIDNDHFPILLSTVDIHAANGPHGRYVASTLIFESEVYLNHPSIAVQTTWVHDWEDPLVRRVSIKVRYLSNLTIESAEALHVINYGVAGHNEPHYDFTRHRENDPFGAAKGKRLATVIFYMTDVEAGGATVFTLLGIKLRPEKGSVAIWHNLKLNGERNYKMHHAACPVITGNKWVANKWLHERGQEFVHPCHINPYM